MSRILALDVNGLPHRWVSQELAITYHAKKLVAWQLGDDEVQFRGGYNRITGKQSRIVTAPIIAVKGESGAARRMNTTPALTNRELFRRDRHLCAYCGRKFMDVRLTRDHVVPTSKGGKDEWMNVVTACGNCNNQKGNRLLEDCGMELLYVPYVPNRAEALILENRNVLASQMEYLLAFVPGHSRVWEELKTRAN